MALARVHAGQGSGMPPKLEQGAATERVQIVAPETWLQRVEEWRRKQPKIPSKSEAIRILVEMALDAEDRSKKGT